MKSEEYKKLGDIEQQHWFYKGKRAIVRGWIKRFVHLKPTDLWVDVGCGTGIFVEELSKECRSYGIEPSPEGIELYLRSNRSRNLVAGSILSLPVQSQTVDIATSLDVFEHIKDDRQAISEIIRVVRKGGLIVIMVPAFQWVMSDWDVALGHYRRYNFRDFDELLRDQPVMVLHKSYINSLMFLPIVCYRLFRKIFRLDKIKRLEDIIPSAVINQILYYIFVGSAMIKWPRMPIGLSVFLILKRE